LSFIHSTTWHQPDEIIAFGDSNNDLSMIEFTGLGVVMGIASEVIKAQADFVTDTNMYDGIAKFLKGLYKNTTNTVGSVNK
jgi:hydroxymethylpyrimidine pyrophosphatase-like HAD family hydrolase